VTATQRRGTAAGVAIIVATVLALLVVDRLRRQPGPRPLFQLPVTCGETWRLSTYPGHDDFDVDLFPTQGEAWGRPVLAAAGGTVIESGINGALGGRTKEHPNGPKGRGGGWWVKIDHGDRWETQYLHMIERPLVSVGDDVAGGQQIGKVGSTGDSGAPHLHYEQRRSREKTEAYFGGEPSGITTDDHEYTVERVSKNCV
jgi:hypothetical protein